MFLSTSYLLYPDLAQIADYDFEKSGRLSNANLQTNLLKNALRA